jgi:hypothetical protein
MMKVVAMPGYADAFVVKRELQAVIEWLDEREEA